MSKQSDAKAAQGYDPKPMPKTCMNCANFTCDRSQPYLPHNEYWLENNLRCTIGGFAVKKMATCDKFEVKNEHSA
jgi:hypothetical protein